MRRQKREDVGGRNAVLPQSGKTLGQAIPFYPGQCQVPSTSVTPAVPRGCMPGMTKGKPSCVRRPAPTRPSRDSDSLLGLRGRGWLPERPRILPIPPALLIGAGHVRPDRDQRFKRGKAVHKVPHGLALLVVFVHRVFRSAPRCHPTTDNGPSVASFVTISRALRVHSPRRCEGQWVRFAKKTHRQILFPIKVLRQSNRARMASLWSRRPRSKEPERLGSFVAFPARAGGSVCRGRRDSTANNRIPMTDNGQRTGAKKHYTHHFRLCARLSPLRVHSIILWNGTIERNHAIEQTGNIQRNGDRRKACCLTYIFRLAGISGVVFGACCSARQG